MPTKVTGFSIWIHVQFENSGDYLLIDYTPTARGTNHPEQQLTDYKAQFQTKLDALPVALQAKLRRLGEYGFGSLDVPQLDLGDVTGRGSVERVYFQVLRRGPARGLHIVYRMGGGPLDKKIPISDATERLIDNIWPTFEQMAWNHLRNKLGAAMIHTAEKLKVFLSYRKGPADRVDFVTAIAHRLGREGFLPWFDAWEILAGDSLPREIGDGLDGMYAIVVVLTTDYPSGKWAREELEAAITQRVERSIKIIPVLYEPCERPTLLQSLRYVDCTTHDPSLFEGQFLEIIDALNEIDLNPYRG